MESNKVKKHLYAATCIYLSLPYLVFIGGWLRQPYATIGVLLLVAGIAGAIGTIRRRLSEDTEPGPPFALRTLGWILLPVCLIAVLAGAGGWGFQDTDWFKHNAILLDLVKESWPVIYEVKGERVMLTYYTAYQLPAALIGKLFGWQAANHALFLYTLIGFCLSAVWMWILSGARNWWFIVLFLLFSGMDVIGFAITTVYQASSGTDAWNEMVRFIGGMKHLEWWAGWGFAQFSSNAALMVWVPNQAIAGWLLTSLMLNDARLRCLHQTGLLYLAFCSMWAPFVGLGLIPFVIAIVIYQWFDKHPDKPAWHQLFSLPNLAGAATGLVAAVYLAGRFQDYALPIDLDSVYHESITLTFLRLPDKFILKYCLFVGLEFAALHALLYLYLTLQRKPKLRPLLGLLIISTVILFGLPILNWGWNNEPAMRSSIPALFVTVLVTIRVLSDTATTSFARWVRRAILLLIAVGSLNAAVELGRHVSGVYQQRAIVHILEPDEIRSLFELQEQRYKPYYNFVGQYVGSADSFFAKYLARN